MHKLWEDHITNKRNVIISALAGLPDQQAVTERLRNQDDIGNAVKPFFGDAGGAQLTQLLRTHIALAAEIITLRRRATRPNLPKSSRLGAPTAVRSQAFWPAPMPIGTAPNWRPRYSSTSI
jgi:hypothetical protein